MTTLYTSIGQLELRTDSEGNRHPVIIASKKEQAMGIHEMLVWTCLAWRVMNITQLQELYYQKAREAGVFSNPDVQIVLDSLLRRNLAAVGIGNTDGDALHDLFSELYVVPVDGGIAAKVVAFLRLILIDGVSFRRASRLFYTGKLPPDQKRILNLVRQQLMSTSEIIKCVDEGVHDISTDEKLLDAIYYDDYTTCENIGFYARTFQAWKPALTAVANLYLRQLIIFERI